MKTYSAFLHLANGRTKFVGKFETRTLAQAAIDSILPKYKDPVSQIQVNG
jgi:hypothetical protein